jgi:hypothetical protein
MRYFTRKEVGVMRKINRDFPVIAASTCSNQRFGVLAEAIRMKSFRWYQSLTSGGRASYIIALFQSKVFFEKFQKKTTGPNYETEGVKKNTEVTTSWIPMASVLELKHYY